MPGMFELHWIEPKRQAQKGKQRLSQKNSINTSRDCAVKPGKPMKALLEKKDFLKENASIWKQDSW